MALLVVIIIPTFCTSMFFYVSASHVVKTNVRQSSLQIAKQAADSLSFMLNVGSDTSDFVYNDLHIQQTMMKKDTDLPVSEQEEDKTYIDHMLNNLIYSSSFVKFIYVMRDNGSSWGSGVFSQNKLSRYRLDEFPWIREATSQDGRLVWSALQYDLFSGAGDNMDLVLPVTRVMKDFKTLQNIGYVMINLDGKAVLDKISQIRLGRTGSFFVTDREGNVMIHPDAKLLNHKLPNADLSNHIVRDTAQEFEYEVDGVPYYGVKQALANGWYIVGTVPVREITGQLGDIHNSVIFSAVLFALISVAVGLFIARRITKPLIQLTKQMKLAEGGNFNVRTLVQSSDEIGVLSKQFNRMIYNIEQLMGQVREEQNKKQQAEVRAVMHRINPHFLFNTLNTIRWLLKLGQTERAATGLTGLTQLLESNMGKEGHMITLGQELDIIQKYMFILQLRYEVSIHLDLAIDARLREMPVPRMMLQPLVENAVFHGIVPKGTDGEIRIRAMDTAGAVEIFVSDNGLGIGQDVLSQIERRTQEGDMQETGIGLKHVKECVSLYFPSGSEIQIRSQSAEGTTVYLKLMKEAG